MVFFATRAADTAEISMPMIDEREEHVARLIGRRIKIARRSKRVTQNTLAEHLGVEPTTIGYYERGQHRLSAARFVQIAALLERPLHFFVDPEMDAGAEPPVRPRGARKRSDIRITNTDP